MLEPYHTVGCLEAGVDEAGVGCLAGPVFAAGVIWPPELTGTALNDSKKLTARKREQLWDYIRENAIDWSIAQVEPRRIDEINIRNARIEAMHHALDQLNIVPNRILVDGDAFKPYGDIEHTCIIRGDGKYLSIAAASVLAKVARDRYMCQLHQEYPEYGWDRNKGYPTKAHYESLRQHGPSPQHRRSFRLS